MLLALAAMSVAVSTEPILDMLPVDRFRIPGHLPLAVTIQMWMSLDEETAKKEVRWERYLLQQDRRELAEWEHTCSMYRRLRDLGIERVPSDPPKPQPTKWAR